MIQNLYVTEIDKNLNLIKLTKKDYFLGAWCFSEIDNLKKKNILNFHWEDLKKRKKDYLYLEELRIKLLKYLSKELNTLHYTNKSIRYWTILLDPWLTSYISIMFDRWESLLVATKKDKFVVNHYKEIVKKNEVFLFEIISSRASDPFYNQLIYQRLYNEKFFKDKLKIVYKYTNVKKKLNRSNLFKEMSLIKFFIFYILQFLERASLKKNYFAYPFSSLPATVMLKIKLFCSRQVLFFFNEIYKIEKKIYIRLKKKNIKFKIRKQKFTFKSKNNFESFLSKYLLKDLPSCIIEDYGFVLKEVNNIKLKPKVTIASANYWNTFSFKLWIAEMVEKRNFFIICDHGRGLIPYKEVDCDNDMCDIKFSWHTPVVNKQIQVPALYYTIFNNFFFGSSKYCSVIGYEQNKNVNYISFYAISSLAIKTYEQVIEMYKILLPPIKNKFRIKARKFNNFPSSWNLESFYKKTIGINKIYNGPNYEKFVKNSKIVICTYPLTTLSDSITLNKPTILLLPKSTYLFHAKFKKIINKMEKNKILFYESKKAAEHINKIWDNPEKWWNSPRVLSLRKEYKKNFCQFDKTSLNQWYKILENNYNNKNNNSD
jgi:putative transferase (TIGR04331 family)